MLKINIEVLRGDFSFQMNEEFDNGITGIFGPSGAGKTTFLQSIAGLVTPQSGVINSNGVDLFSYSSNVNVKPWKRDIGYVFQEGLLFPHLSIIKNLRYGIKTSKTKSSCITEEDVVSILNLERLLGKHPSELSGGERQRVAIGRALLASPQVLLLDEPFSSLDQQLRGQIIQYISKISKHISIPILVVSHDLHDILKLTDRICLIEQGRVRAHSHFKNLILDKNCREALSQTEVISMTTLEVKEINSALGLITLNGFGAEKKVKILLEPSMNNYKQGDLVRVFIKPNDVVLSTKSLENSSFQNELKGEIVSINTDGAKAMCMIDCGFPLLAEISNASVKQLSLNSSSKVYCSFKTLALDTLNVS